MSRGLNLTVPDEADEWPHEARAFVLAEANTAADLRQEIDSLAGMTIYFHRPVTGHLSGCQIVVLRG